MKKCKGLFFRGSESSYFKNGVYGLRKYLKLLKRPSCDGKCGGGDCVYTKEALEIASSDGDTFPEIDDGIWQIYMVDEYEVGFFRVGTHYVEEDKVK